MMLLYGQACPITSKNQPCEALFHGWLFFDYTENISFHFINTS